MTAFLFPHHLCASELRSLHPTALEPKAMDSSIKVCFSSFVAVLLLHKYSNLHMRQRNSLFAPS